jgi:uncharacterized repeat protein (TIGR01451 family)
MDLSMQPKPERHERQDWAIVLILLLIGFLCVILAGQWALHLSPSWKLNTDMGSKLDPNSDFLTDKPVDFIVPLNPDILTKPAWDGLFTPGVKFVTRTPLPPPPLSVSTAAVTETSIPATSPVGTSTVAVTHTGTLAPTNTFVWLPLPASSTPKPKKTKEPPPDTPTNTPIPSGDLVITMSDGGVPTYLPGNTVTYTIQVTSISTFDVTGTVVTDLFSAQFTGGSWTCLAAGGATCAPAGGYPLTDTIFLPAAPGASVTYTVTANVHPLARGVLENTAYVTAPAGFIETNPGNDRATTSTAGPGGGGGTINIGPGDGNPDYPPRGTVIEMVISPAIVGDGTGNYDFVFYERYAPPLPSDHIDLDAIEILISSDGSTWHTVFYWGGGGADTNTNVDVPVDSCITEVDNCSIFDTSLYNSTGIAIDIDSLGLSGSYPWIQIVSPQTAPFGPDNDGAADIDAIQPYYP